MKKIIFTMIFAAIAMVASAQEPDKIYVGPYEVIYYGKGDFEYILMQDVDLYDFYKLQKDTTIIIEEKSEPMKNGVQLNLTMRMPLFSTAGMSKVIGIEAGWKQKIANNLFINAGLGLNVGSGTYAALPEGMSMVEVGVPINLEYTKLNREKASLYISAGLTPSYFSTIKGDFTVFKEELGNKPSGFYVAPRVDFGGYIPALNQLVKIGVYAQYNAGGTIYKDAVGRAYVGGNIGIVF